MSSHEHPPAVEPEDLERLFVERVDRASNSSTVGDALRSS
jgi:hypothetical protein